MNGVHDLGGTDGLGGPEVRSTRGAMRVPGDVVADGGLSVELVAMVPTVVGAATGDVDVGLAAAPAEDGGAVGVRLLVALVATGVPPPLANRAVATASEMAAPRSRRWLLDMGNPRPLLS